MKSERPDPILGVICGSLCIAQEAFRKRFADYQVLLERCVCVCDLLGHFHGGIYKHTLLLLLLSPSFLSYFRGQVMNAEMLSNVVDVELISEGVKYSLKVQRTLSSIAVF